MAIFKKPNFSSITVADGWVTIHSGDDKSKEARGDVLVPAAAIRRVTCDDNFIRIHVDGVVHPARSITHNRYAVSYVRSKTATAVVAEIEAAMAAAEGTPIPEGWVPEPQPAKAIEQAEKQSYEMWEAGEGGMSQRIDAFVAEVNERAERAKEESFAKAGEAPVMFKDRVVAEFGDVKLYTNHTIVFNGDNYSAVGARGSIDAGLANNKKFSGRRIITGVAAVPLVGVLGLAGLIRKQKGQLVLEIELADGRLLVTVGPTKQQTEALKVVQALGKIAPAPNTSAPEQVVVAAPLVPATPVVDTDALAKLAELHAAGILTDEEFAAAKAKALGL